MADCANVKGLPLAIILGLTAVTRAPRPLLYRLLQRGLGVVRH
jgi:hypothetical protein